MAESYRTPISGTRGSRFDRVLYMGFTVSPFLATMGLTSEGTGSFSWVAFNPLPWSLTVRKCRAADLWWGVEPHTRSYFHFRWPRSHFWKQLWRPWRLTFGLLSHLPSAHHWQHSLRKKVKSGCGIGTSESELLSCFVWSDGIWSRSHSDSCRNNGNGTGVLCE